MHCGRCQADWCWVCNQVANELHYEMTFSNLFRGCPGLQFRLDNGCLLSLCLISIFLFCPVIFSVGPVLWGFFAAFVIAGKIVDSCCFSLCRFRYQRNCCCKLTLVLLNLFLYILLWAVAEVFTLAFGVIVGACAVLVLTLPTMLYVIYFGVRLLCLRCKRLK